MKIKRAVLLICILALCISWSFVGMNAFADGIECFSSTQTGVSVTTSTKGISTAIGTAGQVMTLNYSTSVDFTNGASFKYVIPKATDIQIDAEARSTGNNYILATVKDDSGYGIEFKVYALFSKTATSRLNKMQVDVTYLDPSITKTEGDYTPGRQYIETFSTYTNVEDSFHTIDVHKESGMWFFAADGYSALPVTLINKNLVLDNCSVSLSVYSKDKNPTVKVYPIEKGILKSFVIDGFMQLGSDIVTKNSDDTTKIKVADMIAAENPGQLIRYREQLISTIGYDVRKPINIEYSYDVSNASAVWYALGLGRGNILESIGKIKYDVNGNNANQLDGSGYSDSLAAKNDGIMIQTTTGLAQPTYQPQNSRLAPYKTNSKSKPYSGRADIDIVTFIVNENGTEMFMNGDLIFDNLITKLSDFEDNNYLAYPYFHFFEDKANVDKGNTIVIKGVNAARRTDNTSLKIVGNSSKDLEVGLTNNENGDISLWVYEDNDLIEVPSSFYFYNDETKKLTIKYDWFNGKEYDVYKLYAKNKSASEEIAVRFSDPTLTTIPASTDKNEYTWIKGGENLVIKVDIHNGIWVSFSGGGISSSGYQYVPNASTSEGTITINKGYLDGKKVGSYTYTIKTTNIEEETFTSSFKIIIQNEENDLENNSDTQSSGNDSSNVNNRSGCGSSLNGINILSIVIFAVFIIIRVKKLIIKE